jgi:EmrB/QacA subfamily drug resistance transporter
MAHRWKVLLVTAVAVFMAFLDVTIVNIAFPDIQASFPDTSRASLSWVLNAYNIVFAALLVPAGRLADLVGRKRLFFVGLFVFMGASALCGLAPSVPFLVAARVLQAVGGALLVPTSLGLLLPEFPPQMRATATSIWGATGAVAAATGPSLGGLLVHWSGWRLVFFVNLVIGLAALVPARRLLVEQRDEESGALPDAIGVGLLTFGVGALSLGIVKGPDWGWGSAEVVGSLALAAVLLVLFPLRSARHANPVVELSLFKVRSFAAANVGVFVFSMAFYAMLLAHVLFLTGVWHYSVLKAGFALTPGPLTAAVGSVIGGRLADRFGQRAVGIPGGLLFGLGCLLFALNLDASPDYLGVFLPANIITGAGVGLSFAAFSSAAVAELPPSRFATGSAVAATSRQLGAVLGIAILVAVLGTPTGAGVLDSFHHAYALMAAGGLAAAAVALTMGRFYAGVDLPGAARGEVAG